MLAGAVVALSMIALVSQPPAVLPDDARAQFDHAKLTRRKIFEKSPPNLSLAGDYILVTIDGGFPPPTMAATLLVKSADGVWHWEAVWLGQPSRGGLRRGYSRQGAVAKRDAARIEEFLASPQLFRESNDVFGGCTDQPVTTIQVKDHGRWLEAARSGCPPKDHTERLIEAVEAVSPTH